jgi:hypothetical protein
MIRIAASRLPSGAVMVAALLSGCFQGEGADIQLLVPADVALYWDSSFDGLDDGRMALIPADVMVYDGETGEALEGVLVDVAVPEGFAGLLLPDEVRPVDEREALGAEAPGADFGWDAWRDRYFDVAGAVPRSALRVATDAAGLGRVYVFIDGFPGGPESFGSIPVHVGVVDSGVDAEAHSTDAIEDSFWVVAR